MEKALLLLALGLMLVECESQLKSYIPNQGVAWEGHIPYWDPQELTGRKDQVKLVGVSLSRGLTFPELKQALAGLGLDIRVIYSFVGGITGTEAYADPLPASEFLRDFPEDLERDVVWWQDTSRRYLARELPKVQGELGIARDKLPEVSDFQASAQARQLAFNVIWREYSIAALKEAALGRRPLISGIQLRGKVQDLAEFGRRVEARGFTENWYLLHSNIRPKLPPDLQADHDTYHYTLPRERDSWPPEQVYQEFLEALEQLGYHSKSLPQSLGILEPEVLGQATKQTPTFYPI